MFTSQVKKEEEPGSSLTRALSHGGAASVHTGYFKTFSPQKRTSLLLMFTRSSEFRPCTPHPNKLERATRRLINQYVHTKNNHLNPNSHIMVFQFWPAFINIYRANLFEEGLCITSPVSMYPQCACIRKVMLIHLIQRTGCFQACGVKRKRSMWVWLCACVQREREGGEGEQRWGEKERVGWAFLSSLQEHKGQSNTSSGVVAKTANLALFLLLYFTIAVC